MGRSMTTRAAVIMVMVVGCKNASTTPCDDLFSRFRAAAGAEADPQRTWFMARCTAADERAAGCAGEVLTEFSGPQEMKNFALAVGIPACVQKHRTRTAGPDAGNRVAAAKLGTGLVKLPDALATLSLDETAWIGARPDGRTWVFLPTWRGRCRNVAGFLWSSGAFEPGDFSKDDGGRTMWIVGFTATDACSKGTEPEPWTSEHEPFTVLERPHDQWVFIQWGWD